MQSERALLGSGVRGAQRLEAELRAAVDALAGAGSPPRLAAAVGDALFPGGQRLRPRLLLAICAAEGGQESDFAFDAAVAVECVHAASLVHDDLPCFDDADLRRGKPTIHKRYDEATALLVGDGLLTLAFERLAASDDPRAMRALRILLRATGLHGGLIAGQGWELEPSTKASPDESAVRRYHAGKTSGLFAAAASMGALAAGADTHAYTALGYRIGSLYQLADDLLDATATAAATGKSSGRDEALERPSLVRIYGVTGARAAFAEAFDDLLDAAPNRAVCTFLEAALAPIRALILPGDVDPRRPAIAV